MNARKIIIASAIILLHVAMTQASSYDVSADWSDTQNPNGLWSYYVGGALGVSGTRSGDIFSDPPGPPPIWTDAPGAYTWLGWSRSNGSELFQTAGELVQGDVYGHTGYTESLTIEWTSPLAGQVTVSGGVWAIRDIDRWNDWQLSLNGTVLVNGTVGSGDEFSRSSPAPIDLLLEVNPGDTIAFTASPAAGSPYPDYIAVDLRIVPVSPEPANTPQGSGIVVSPVDTTTGTTPVTLTFEQVTQSGNTILITSSTGPARPAGYGLGNPPTYYNFTTTASYTGLIDVCISYSGISFTAPPESLRLMRYENGQWVDSTTAVNTGNQTVCGAINSLVPLAIMLDEEPVYFADANLKQAVMEALGLTTDPTPSDMLALYDLYARGREITNLTGLEYAQNLWRIDLDNNLVADITPLSQLANLRALGMSGNSISDISPIASLLGLRSLSLNQNQISDITSLSNLVELSELYLNENQISDISALSNLPLGRLYLSRNLITDIGALSGCPLSRLVLSYNSITDISPLANHSHLSWLDLTSNQIGNITLLSGLVSLMNLYLANNHISEIGALSGMFDLYNLNLEGNQISDITALSGIARLFVLNLSNNQITNIAALSGKENLDTLYLNNNQISDISALSGSIWLRTLALTNNQVGDISVLSNMMGPINLYLNNNQISDIGALSGKTYTKYIRLENNQISNIDALQGVTNLRELYLYGNQISDISVLSGMPYLTTLNLTYNQISDMSPVANLSALRSLNLGVNPITTVPSLPNLSNLTYLGLYSCAINSVADLSGLTSIQELNLYNNRITDVSGLSGLSQLKTLHLGWNQISDISPLAGLTSLELLDIRGNQFSDISPLAGLTNLRSFWLTGCGLTDISVVANFSLLNELRLQSNQITDVSSLSGLTNLTSLLLSWNQITDVSWLSNLSGLTLLSIEGNPLGCEAYSIDIPLIQANNPGLALSVDPIPYNCQPNPTPEGCILFEYFYGTDHTLGSLLALPIFPDSPSRTDLRTSFEGPTNWRPNYGTRARGYVYPPATGDYTFWIASDDQSQLWLSADEEPVNAVQIASVPGWTPARDFDNTGGGAGGPEQMSSPVYLEAGRRYYIEALCVQGGGGDNLAVAWQGPSIPIREVISGTFLSAWVEDSDGVPSSVEDGAPNGGDGNTDGVPDSQQNNVASLPNAVDGQYVTLVSSEGTEVQNVIAHDNPSPADAPPGVEFPVGFFDFSLSGMGVGGSATVTILLPAGHTPQTYYKYGPTPDNPSDHWYEFLYDGATGAEILLDQIILHFVDGLRGDNDLLANGVITDPGAPGFLLNHPPEVVITAPSLGFIAPVGTAVTLAGGIIDQDLGDSHTATWTITAEHWTQPLVVDGAVSGSLVSGQVTFPGAGIYWITLTVTDAAGARGMTDTVNNEMHAFIVVYDPQGGFVTGGGWIWSPPGALAADPLLEGKATLGFNSKYRKGATIPTGQTEFIFRTGDLNFHSNSYDWLVVTGSDYAKFKGAGTINGVGEYTFMVWAGDKDPDTFRIRIWLETATGGELVVYDNGFDQEVGGGSIVIHTE